MCLPLASAGLVTGALSIASTAAGFVGAYQQAKAQAEYQGRMAQARADQIEQNNINVMAAYQSNLEQVNARQIQENAAAGQQAQAYQRENAVRRGAAQVATGESGASGISRDMLMAEFDRTQASYMSSLSMQQDFRDQSVFFETQGMQQQAIGRAQSIQPYIPTPVNGPSLFGAAVGIGSGAMQGYDTHLRYTSQGYANPDPTKMGDAPSFGGFIRQGLGIDPTPGFS